MRHLVHLNQADTSTRRWGAATGASDKWDMTTLLRSQWLILRSSEGKVVWCRVSTGVYEGLLLFRGNGGGELCPLKWGA